MNCPKCGQNDALALLTSVLCVNHVCEFYDKSYAEEKGVKAPIPEIKVVEKDHPEEPTDPVGPTGIWGPAGDFGPCGISIKEDSGLALFDFRLEPVGNLFKDWAEMDYWSDYTVGYCDYEPGQWLQNHSCCNCLVCSIHNKWETPATTITLSSNIEAPISYTYTTGSCDIASNITFTIL